MQKRIQKQSGLPTNADRTRPETEGWAVNKAEYIERYGEEAWQKRLEENKEWERTNRERRRKTGYIKLHGEEAWQMKLEKRKETRKSGNASYERELEQQKEWREKNHDKIEAYMHERSRKGGKYYKKMLEDNKIGLRGERNKVRSRHRQRWSSYKKIIAPDSVIHHAWVDNSAAYTGVALVEKDQHQHGYIDVIKILDGKITLLTEEQFGKEEEKMNEKQI